MLITILTSVVWKICQNGKYQTNTENELVNYHFYCFDKNNIANYFVINVETVNGYN